MKPQAGWYVDWEDNRRQRFFTGSSWYTETAERTAEAKELPVDFDRDAAAKSVRKTNTGASDGLKSAAGYVYFLAWIAGIGALVAGIALMLHSIPNCVPNPYNDNFGTDLSDCSGKLHPFIGAGAGVLAAGLVQAFVLAVVGRLCLVVSEQRVMLRDLLEAE